jgi:hypothetical protein
LAYFFFSLIFNIGAAAIVFGFSFFGFFASLYPFAGGRLGLFLDT